MFGASFLNMTGIIGATYKAHPVYELIDRVPTIKLDEKDSQSVPVIDTDITLSNVSFTYKSRSNTTLDGVSLSIPKGSFTAFVGPSGSGKSTVAKMLMRFYDPDRGSISMNGTDLKNLNLREYRHRIGYVGQEPCLFHESIRNNLLNAKPDATDDEMWQALSDATAAEFVEQLPEQLDTDVGAIGSKLSGGQKQRIAIARALINKPDVLIFDEATSALDMKNEQKIQEAIERISADDSITKIVIAHRLSTIIQADQIVMFENGKITAIGKYQELVSTHIKSPLSTFNYYPLLYEQVEDKTCASQNENQDSDFTKYVSTY